MNETLIRGTAKSQGWQEVVKLFQEEITENKLPKNFLTTGKTADVIALECASREQASKMVEKVLQRIKNIANKEDKKADPFR